MNHCPHYVPEHEEVSAYEYCCQCGVKRAPGKLIAVPLTGHGPYLRPQESRWEFPKTWTDECKGQPA